MKRLFLFCCFFPSLALAITFQAGTYKYSAEKTYSNTSSLVDRVKKHFSLENIVLANDNKFEAGLGFGFSNDRKTPTVMCVNGGNATYGGSGEGLIDVARSYSLYEVKKQLHMNADADVDIGIFSDEMAADFVRNLEQDRYSESFIYRTWIKLKNSVYNPPEQGDILNGLGKRFQNDPAMFRQVCGDQYVAQMEWGGYLYVAVKFIFNSESDMQTFNSAMSGAFGDVFQMSAKFSQAMSMVNKNGAIKIQAYQLGGDPTKLGRILGGEGGQAPIVYCSFDDLARCKQMLDNVIIYATNTTGDNFPTQITIGSATTPVSAANTNLDLLDYIYLGVIIQSKSKLTQEIKDARKELAQVLEQTKADEDRAKFLISRFSYVGDYVGKLQSLLQTLQQNESSLMSAGSSCFSDLDGCVNAAKTALANLKPINRNLLEQPFEQDINVAVGGDLKFVRDPKWHWIPDTPSVTYDLKSGGVAFTNYPSISANGGRLAEVPPCQNTNIWMLGNTFNSLQETFFAVCWFDTTVGSAAIQQQPTCSNGYNIVFGGLGQGQKQQTYGPCTPELFSWHDSYSLTYRIMHYSE
ncbi:MAG: hypothetical protein M1561_04795 [Gammaproteobacteria bacterium]|nr:hypothetical protein [Gammaproteobacteria bacterium]